MTIIQMLINLEEQQFRKTKKLKGARNIKEDNLLKNDFKFGNNLWYNLDYFNINFKLLYLYYYFTNNYLLT